MTTAGNSLILCFEAISSYGKEIDALSETLGELLVKNLGTSSLPCKVIDKLKYDNRMSDTGWVCTDVASSLPLMGKHRRKKKPELYLGFQISVAGDGVSFHGNNEPLIHVNFWENAVDFDQESYMHYPLEEAQIKNNRLLFWNHETEGWNKDEWTFSIRLLTLDSSQALIDRVIHPAIALLRGEEITKALPDDLIGLVIYSDERVIRSSN